MWMMGSNSNVWLINAITQSYTSQGVQKYLRISISFNKKKANDRFFVSLGSSLKLVQAEEKNIIYPGNL